MVPLKMAAGAPGLSLARVTGLKSSLRERAPSRRLLGEEGTVTEMLLRLKTANVNLKRKDALERVNFFV